MKKPNHFFRKTLLMTLVSFCALVTHAQWVQLGSDITTTAKLQEEVAISDDGLRIAFGNYVAIPFFHASEIKTYEFNQNNWAPYGDSILGGSTGLGEVYFGWSIAMSSDGSRITVGGPDSGTDVYGSDDGLARVYTHQGNNWSQLSSDLYPATGNGSHFGWSTAMSSDGNTVAIGAPGFSTNQDLGSVWVYRYQSGNWSQLGTNFIGSGTDELGTSVSLSSDGLTLAYSAPRYTENNIKIGKVAVYRYESGVWVQQGGDLTGGNVFSLFGYETALSASGDTLAIGAIADSENGDEAGKVKVYHYTSGNWVQLGNDLLGDAPEDFFGYSLDIAADGRTIAAGAPYNDENGPNSGKVTVYRYDQGDWTQAGDAFYGDEQGANSPNGLTGRTVALSSSGDVVAFNDLSKIRVYQWCNGMSVEGNGIEVANGSFDVSTLNGTDFGLVPIGAPQTQTFTITNQNSTAITINDLAVEDFGTNAFTLTPPLLPYTLSAQSSFNFDVTFDPDLVDDYKAVVTISSTDCTETDYQFGVAGQGVPPLTGPGIFFPNPTTGPLFIDLPGLNPQTPMKFYVVGLSVGNVVGSGFGNEIQVEQQLTGIFTGLPPGLYEVCIAVSGLTPFCETVLKI